MSFTDLISDLNQAICENNLSTVSEILLKNPNLMKNEIEMFKLCDEKPLEVALKKGSVECIELLLQNGARTDGLEWKFYSPAHVVFDYPRSDKNGEGKQILQLLFEYGQDRNFFDIMQRELLHAFIGTIAGSSDVAVEIAEVLLDAGVPIDEVNEFSGFTPLELSINKGYEELASFLIKRGADLQGSDTLYLATRKNMANIVNLLLAHGADVNAINNWGCTALHLACEYHFNNIISLLLREGANVNIEIDGEPPFSKLDSEVYEYQYCIEIMVEEFAKLSFENRFISKKNIDLIQATLMAQEHFEKCKNELSQMKSTIFYPPYSFYDLMKISNNDKKKLANFTKNEELALKFKSNLKNFSFYGKDLVKIWKEAIGIKNKNELVYSRLHSVFCEYLPSVVIENLSENLSLEDLPLE